MTDRAEVVAEILGRLVAHESQVASDAHQEPTPSEWSSALSLWAEHQRVAAPRTERAFDVVAILARHAHGREPLDVILARMPEAELGELSHAIARLDDLDALELRRRLLGL